MAHTYRDIPAAGTAIYIDIGGYDDFVLIPGATDIAWEDVERGVREATPLSATAVVKKPGMMNWGKVTATVFYDPNDSVHQDIIGQLELSAAAQGAALDNFKIVWGGDGFPTPAETVFDGFVTTFSTSASDPETGTVEAELSIEITGQPTHTPGSPAE